MTTLATTKKQTTSIKLLLDTKQALERFAEQENRSVHYLPVTTVEEFVTHKQEEADCQEYTKNRVMRAYNEMKENGSQGVSSSQAKEIVMQQVKEKLENNQ